MKKWIVGSTIAVAAIASVLFFSTYSLGTTRYVRTGCTNAINTYDATTNSCTGGSSTVYSSIANALAANTTVAGDTLYIRAGTYADNNINSNIRTIPSGTSWANVATIAAYPSETVTITPSGSPSELVNLAHPTVKYVVFERLIFDGLGQAQDLVSFYGGANHVRFLNCEFKNAYINGIHMGWGNGLSSDANEFVGCLIHNIGIAGSGYGIYTGTSDNIVDNCQFYNMPRYGMHQFTNAPGETSNRNIIKNSKFYNTGQNAAEYSAAIILSSGTGNVAFNNLIYSNLRGIQFYSTSVDNAAYNNTIYNNTYQGFVLEGGATRPKIRNNIIYGNGDNEVHNNGANSPTYSNNLCGTTNLGCMTPAGNPAFVNAAGADFHLTAGSPAIGKGCTSCGTELSSLYTTDFEGNARGTVPWDVGAYEYGAVAGDSMTINSPASGAQWTIGSQQTITWTCIGCTGPIDINIDRANAGTFTESIVQDYPLASGSSYTWTVTGSGTDNQVKIRVRDNDGTPTQTTANFTIQVASGGGLTKRISDNTTGTKVGDIPGTQDTYLAQVAPAAPQGNDTCCFFAAKPGAGNYSHGLIRFTGLSQIPTTATVTSVTLGLYMADAEGTGNETIDIRKVLRTDVTEPGASWNYRVGTTAWQTAGGTGALDRSSTLSASLTPVTATPGYVTVTSTGQFKTDIQNDVTAGTQSWFHLEDTVETAGVYRGFTSRESSNSANRPYLEVTYTVGTSTITVTEPKAGDLFLSGQTGPVRWTSQGISGNVRIDLSRDGGTTWETMTASTGYNDADETLTYNAPTSSNCKVRVVSLNDTSIVGTSSAFRIGGTRAGFVLVP